MSDLPPEGHPLQKLGACLANWLQDDNFNNAEVYMLEVWSQLTALEGEKEQLEERLKEHDKPVADFLWPVEEDSLEQLGYEFANAGTEDYRHVMWKEIAKRFTALEGEKERLIKQVEEASKVAGQNMTGRQLAEESNTKLQEQVKSALHYKDCDNAVECMVKILEQALNQDTQEKEDGPAGN